MTGENAGSFRPGVLWLLLFFLISSINSAPVHDEDTTELAEYNADESRCYYNFEYYDEGDRIITNEPCLNCTCHNRMLMCYLRVCPFTKAIGQDCKVEKRADQCCPVITCPEVPVHLLTSTTTAPSTSDSTEVGFQDNYGCSINDKFYADGAQLPTDPNNPCELCYCIRNRTTCVMQECTLRVAGCKPVYHPGICCPVKYNCDHEEESGLETTTPGLLMTTTLSPHLEPRECLHNGNVYNDGELINSNESCRHCYCFKGKIACVIQNCGSPMENHGKNCTALPPPEGECCPTTYQCDSEIEKIDEQQIKDENDITATQATIPPEDGQKPDELFPGSDNAIPEIVKPESEVTPTTVIPHEGEQKQETENPLIDDNNALPQEHVDDGATTTVTESTSTETPLPSESEEKDKIDESQITEKPIESDGGLTTESTLTSSEKPSSNSLPARKEDQIPIEEETPSTLSTETPLPSEVTVKHEINVEEPTTAPTEDNESSKNVENKPVETTSVSLEPQESTTFSGEQITSVKPSEEEQKTETPEVDEKKEEESIKHPGGEEEKEPVSRVEDRINEKTDKVEDKLTTAALPEEPPASEQPQDTEAPIPTELPTEGPSGITQEPVIETRDQESTPDIHVTESSDEGKETSTPVADNLMTEKPQSSPMNVEIPSDKPATDGKEKPEEIIPSEASGAGELDSSTPGEHTQQTTPTIPTNETEKPKGIEVSGEQSSEEVSSEIPNVEDNQSSEESSSEVEESSGSEKPIEKPSSSTHTPFKEEITTMKLEDVVTSKPESKITENLPTETEKPVTQEENEVTTTSPHAEDNSTEKDVSDEPVDQQNKEVIPTEIPSDSIDHTEQSTAEIPTGKPIVDGNEDQQTEQPSPISEDRIVTELPVETETSTTKEPTIPTSTVVLSDEDDTHKTPTPSTIQEISTESSEIEKKEEEVTVIPSASDETSTPGGKIESSESDKTTEKPEDITRPEIKEDREITTVSPVNEKGDLKPTEGEIPEKIPVDMASGSTPESVTSVSFESPTTQASEESTPDQKAEKPLEKEITTAVESTAQPPLDDATELSKAPGDISTEAQDQGIPEDTMHPVTDSLPNELPIESQEGVTQAAEVTQAPNEAGDTTRITEQSEIVTETPVVTSTEQPSSSQEKENPDVTTEILPTEGKKDDTTESIQPNDSTGKPIDETQAPIENGTPTPPESEVTSEEPSSYAPPSIPGEGSCLVDGQTFENNSAIPPVNPCQLKCHCVSSIVQCELVQCAPPPSNMVNCIPMHIGDSACCPTYSCDSPSTVSIESDNQLSGHNETTPQDDSQQQQTTTPLVEEQKTIPVSEQSHPISTDSPVTETVPKEESKPTEKSIDNIPSTTQESNDMQTELPATVKEAETPASVDLTSTLEPSNQDLDSTRTSSPPLVEEGSTKLPETVSEQISTESNDIPKVEITTIAEKPSTISQTSMDISTEGVTEPSSTETAEILETITSESDKPMAQDATKSPDEVKTDLTIEVSSDLPEVSTAESSSSEEPASQPTIVESTTAADETLVTDKDHNEVEINTVTPGTVTEKGSPALSGDVTPSHEVETTESVLTEDRNTEEPQIEPESSTMLDQPTDKPIEEEKPTSPSPSESTETPITSPTIEEHSETISTSTEKIETSKADELPNEVEMTPAIQTDAPASVTPEIEVRQPVDELGSDSETPTDKPLETVDQTVQSEVPFEDTNEVGIPSTETESPIEIPVEVTPISEESTSKTQDEVTEKPESVTDNVKNANETSSELSVTESAVTSEKPAAVTQPNEAPVEVTDEKLVTETTQTPTDEISPTPAISAGTPEPEKPQEPTEVPLENGTKLVDEKENPTETPSEGESVTEITEGTPVDTEGIMTEAPIIEKKTEPTLSGDAKETTTVASATDKPTDSIVTKESSSSISPDVSPLIPDDEFVTTTAIPEKKVTSTEGPEEEKNPPLDSTESPQVEEAPLETTVSTKDAEVPLEITVSPKDTEESLETTVQPKDTEKTLETTVSPKDGEESSETTLSPKDTEESIKTTASPENVEEPLETTVRSKDVEESLETTVSPKNVEEPLETTVRSKDVEESLETTVIPKDVEESLETTVIPKDSEESLGTTVNPKELEKPLDTTMSPKDVEESIETTVNPKDVEEAIGTTVNSIDVDESIKTTMNPKDVEESLATTVNTKEMEESLQTTVSPKDADESSGITESPKKEEGSIETTVIPKENEAPSETTVSPKEEIPVVVTESPKKDENPVDVTSESPKEGEKPSEPSPTVKDVEKPEDQSTKQPSDEKSTDPSSKVPESPTETSQPIQTDATTEKVTESSSVAPSDVQQEENPEDKRDQTSSTTPQPIDVDVQQHQEPESGVQITEGLPSDTSSTPQSEHGQYPEPVTGNENPNFPIDGGSYLSPHDTEDYEEEEDQNVYGPGTCRYGGKIYVSAQQIPRDDPCDFCFCFRSDIICLQQSCPPPIQGCHEEPISGFCCPRYQCHVAMATSLNVTTTTTTTTTTLPPHFLSHAYKGAAKRSGCQIDGRSYRVGEVIRNPSRPCLQCMCGGDGNMNCNPKACSPAPVLKEMIAAATAKRRR